MSSHYEGELKSMEHKLNKALRGGSFRGDVSSSNVLLILEQNLIGKKIVSAQSFADYEAWMGRSWLRSNPEDIKKKLVEGDISLLNNYGDI